MSIEELALREFTVALSLIVGMKALCFVLGYLTVRLGHQLIASGVKGEFKFSGSLGGAKADLVSVSPGLLFVLLGVALIAYAMQVEKSVRQLVPQVSGVARPQGLSAPASPFDPPARSVPHDTTEK